MSPRPSVTPALRRDDLSAYLLIDSDEVMTNKQLLQNSTTTWTVKSVIHTYLHSSNLIQIFIIQNRSLTWCKSIMLQDKVFNCDTFYSPNGSHT